MLKNLKNRLNESKGFTLVELIVVIAIMVILIALLVPNVIGYISQAQDTANLAAAKSIYNAANTACVNYKAKKAAWPTKQQLVSLLNGYDGNGTSNPVEGGALVTVGRDTTAVITYDEAGKVSFVGVTSAPTWPSNPYDAAAKKKNTVVYNATTGKQASSGSVAATLTCANGVWKN